MNVLSTNLSYIDGFSDVDAISSKYSMHMLANGEPIASPSCQYISDPISK